MRNGERIWFCQRIRHENEEVPTYKAPEEFILRFQTVFSPIGITCQPKTGFTDYLEYGETTNSDRRIVLQPYQYWAEKFKVGDIFYIDGAEPSDEEEYYGQLANYYVEFVSKQNEAIVLSLKQVKNE